MNAAAHKIVSESQSDTAAFILKLNECYKYCCVYMLASLMIICSLMYYVSYWRQCMQMKRRRELLRRTNQRLARPHRPYAIYREHEVFRKIMCTVRKYQQKVCERGRQAVELNLLQEFQDCEGPAQQNEMN